MLECFREDLGANETQSLFTARVLVLQRVAKSQPKSPSVILPVDINTTSTWHPALF